MYLNFIRVSFFSKKSGSDSFESDPDGRLCKAKSFYKGRKYEKVTILLFDSTGSNTADDVF